MTCPSSRVLEHPEAYGVEARFGTRQSTVARSARRWREAATTGGPTARSATSGNEESTMKERVMLAETSETRFFRDLEVDSPEAPEAERSVRLRTIARSSCGKQTASFSGDAPFRAAVGRSDGVVAFDALGRLHSARGC